MITTKKVKLTPRELFSILILNYLVKRWWLFAWAVVLAIILGLKEQRDSVDLFFMVFAILFPVITAILLWRYVVSRDNRINLLERYYEIEKEKIISIIDQDTYYPIKLEHFIRVDLIQNTYILYLSKNQFIYIPKDSFECDSDREWFENEIIMKIKKK